MPAAHLSRRVTLFAPLVLLSVAVASTGAPEPKPVEEVTYTAPKGWERTEQERLVIFTPPGVAPSKCALIVTPGENLEGDFLQWYRAKWDALRKGGKVIQGGERTALEGPGGSSAVVQAALIESEGANGAKKRTGLLLYAFSVGPAVHWVVFRTDGPDLFNQHKKTVNTFLAGMKFVERVGPRKEKADTKPTPRQRWPAKE